VRAALKTIWEKDRIDALAQRLNDFRAQLSLRILLVLNQQQHRQQQALSYLGEDIQNKIVEVVAVTCEDLKTALAQEKHEIVAAILTTQNGELSALTNVESGSRLSKRLMDGQAIATSVTYSTEEAEPSTKIRGDADDSGNVREMNYKPLTTRSLVDYTGRVLDALHFREMRERHLTIKPEHHETFNWAWETQSFATWSPLSEWLAADKTATGGCYWISGKAGSGKSSLMKYIQKDERTMKHLREWAGTADIVMASCYFWYAGTSLQRSQDGLLRNLLFDVLSERPHLVPIIFPDICRSMISGTPAGNLELSHIELNTAFTKLTRVIPTDLRLFILIDGVDEYNGDHNEICDLLLDAVKQPSVKVLLSSRPIPACVHRFEDCPQLQLQDLTQHDIQIYVSDHLCEFSLMKKMERAEHGITANIAQNIVNRASGVFLWVVLVVRSLQIGLQDYQYNTASDMMEEISKLPPDLEKLYSHMLGNMSHSDRVSGSKLFQIVLRDFEFRTQYPLTAFQLSFCESEDYTDCLRAPMSVLKNDIRDWRCERTEGRLRKQCCGLVEAEYSGMAGYKPIRFLHRTVVEFLQLDSIWDKIVRLTSETSFDAELALMSSSVEAMKATHGNGLFEMAGPFEKLALRFVVCERSLSDAGKAAFHETFLPAMREVLVHKLHDPSLFESPEEEVRAINISAKRGIKRLGLAFPQSFFLSLSLQEYTKSIIQFSTSVGRDIGSLELAGACLLIHFTEEPQGRIRLAMVKKIERLVLHSENPINVKNHSIRQLWNYRWKHVPKERMERGWTVAEYILHYCYSLMNEAEDWKFNYKDAFMVESLLHLISREVVVLHVSKPYSGFLQVVTLGSGTEYQTIAGCFVLRSLMRKISSWMPMTQEDRSDEIARLFSVIDKKLTEVEKEKGIMTEGPAELVPTTEQLPTDSHLEAGPKEGTRDRNAKVYSASLKRIWQVCKTRVAAGPRKHRSVTRNNAAGGH